MSYLDLVRLNCHKKQNKTRRPAKKKIIGTRSQGNILIKKEIVA